MRNSVLGVLAVLAGLFLSTSGWAVDAVSADKTSGDDSVEPELENITVVGSRVIYPVPGEPFHEARGGLFYVRWTQPFK